MKYKNEPVVERHIFRWKNGRTDLVITKVARGYHAFDSCHEKISNNGTCFDMRCNSLEAIRSSGLQIMEIVTGTKEVAE
jgi:hypothetical protein